MSIISGQEVNNYYYEMPNGWYSVRPESVRNQAIATEINEQVASDAWLERVIAGACLVTGIGATLSFGALAAIAFKVSALVVGIFAFPLALIPPLYGLVTTLGGLSIAGCVGYITVKRYAKHFFDSAKEHWAYADHLSKQAHAVRLIKAELSCQCQAPKPPAPPKTWISFFLDRFSI